MVLCEFTVGRTGLQSASRLDSASGVTQSSCGQYERSPTRTHSVNALHVSRCTRNGVKENHGCSRSGGKKASSGIAASRSDSLSFKSTMSASHDLQINSRSKFREPIRKTKRGCTRANLGEELLHNTVRVKVTFRFARSACVFDPFPEPGRHLQKAQCICHHPMPPPLNT